MSSAEVTEIMTETIENCPHGMADATVCPDCLEPALNKVNLADVMRIPPEYECARLSKVPADIRSVVDQYVASWPPPTPMLWLGGGVGAGKTYTACAVLWAIYGRYRVVGRVWNASDITDAYRQASSPDYAGPWSAATLDAALTQAPALVLDDFGAERATEFSTGKLYRVVDARYRERLPTIVTTNVDPGAIDPRIRSRLLSGIEVRFSGPDRRVRA